LKNEKEKMGKERSMRERKKINKGKRINILEVVSQDLISSLKIIIFVRKLN
jgi:hypothetical protein